ncbi:hypothetical protein CDAR_500291 [Caerostris darwini]|uniref:Uncharacterized protein n=1 Tax=Caerostris darwini TaxID=1538125 RepID=A0AAV4M7T6_9ARAC|nr:hypothetical protein CDAR_500291 [Caerostris darwini]
MQAIWYAPSGRSQVTSFDGHQESLLLQTEGSLFGGRPIHAAGREGRRAHNFHSPLISALAPISLNITNLSLKHILKTTINILKGYTISLTHCITGLILEYKCKY